MTTELLDACFTCEALLWMKELKKQITLHSWRPRASSLHQHLCNGGKTKRSWWLAVEYTATCFSPFLIRWIKIRNFKKKYNNHHTLTGGLLTKAVDPLGVYFSRLSQCIFLSLCICKSSMLGHTSAHKAVCTHLWQTCMCTLKTPLQHPAVCNAESKNNRHLLLKPQCLKAKLERFQGNCHFKCTQQQKQPTRWCNQCWYLIYANF